MSESENNVVEAAPVEVANEQQLTDASVEALDAAKIESLKELVGTSLGNIKETPKEEPINVDPMAKLAALKAKDAAEEPKLEEKAVETPKTVGQPIEFKEYLQTLESTKVLQKIDGEMVEIDLKEALQKTINDYSGHQTVDKRMTALDKEKKEVYNTKQAQEQMIQDFNKFREAGDILGGYEYIGSLTGTPSYIIREQLVAALAPEIERRYGLSQQELEYEKLLQEKEYLAQKVEAETRQRKQEQSVQELNATVTRLRETHGIDENLWDKAFKELDQTVPEGQPITPEMVVEKAKSELTQTSIVSKVNPIAKKYNLQEADIKALSDIAKQYPNFTEADIDELVQQSLEEQSKQDTERKLASKYADKTNNKPPEEIDQKEIDRLKRLVGVKSQWE